MACLDDDANGQRRETRLQPVVFRDPQEVNADRVHLHLEHALVHRLLNRFLMRGFQSDALSLDGHGAARLHDELIAVVADWDPADPNRRLRKVSKEKGRRTLEDLEAESQQRQEAQEGVSACVQSHLSSDGSWLREPRQPTLTSSDHGIIMCRIVDLPDWERAQLDALFRQRGLPGAEAICQALRQEWTQR